SFNLENIVPSRGLACLIVKATVDESNKWHGMLGHVNFKNLNKLVKGNLVRGLPSKIFQNDHTCVACQKGKQHKASCKAKSVSSISLPLQFLHMDLFGPTSVRSLNHKTYCLVITDDFSRDFIEFCGSKGIKREYSNARTPQQNGVAKRKNMTLIEAARTMLADSFLPNTFWAEAVSTACYVLNRVLVTKPQNKTPYELITGKIPIISYIRPFGCHVTILNTIDHLGKFEGKSDEGFLVGYSLNSKAFRVYNLETKRVEENLHINFLENKPNVAGKGPNWLFDLDYLTDSMNYQPVRSENQANKTVGPEEANHSAGTQDNIDAGNSEMEADPAQDYFVLPICSSYTSTVKSSESKNEGEKPNKDAGLKTNEEPVDQEDQAFLEELERLKRQEKEATDAVEALRKEFAQDAEDLLPQAGAARATSTNTVNTIRTPISSASPLNVFSAGGPALNNNDQDDSQIPALEDIYDSPSNGNFTNASYDDEGAVADFTNLESTVNIEPKKISQALEDEVRFTQRLPQSLICYLSYFLLKSRYRRGTIVKTLFIKKDKNDIMLVQVYVDDIIFDSTKRSGCDEFEALMKSRFQMSFMGELTFFLGLQVKQKEDGILIQYDKYVSDLKKFYFASVKTVSTPIETQKSLTKDEEAADVDEHLYRSMIGSLMYLTASRPNIMFTVYACSRFQCKKQTIVAYLLTEESMLLHANDSWASIVIPNSKSSPLAVLVKGRQDGNFRVVVQFVDEFFWNTASSQTVNDEKQIHATVNSKAVVVTEASIRSSLLLNVADDTACLTNEAIFQNLALMGLGEPFNDVYITPAHTLKVFSNMSRKGLKFLGGITPLFSNMLASAEVEEGEGSEQPIEPQPTPSPTQPSVQLSNDSPHSGGNTSKRAEGGLNIKELFSLCTNLSNRVLALETAKDAQAAKILKLKTRIKKLEKKCKPGISHHIAWLKSVKRLSMKKRLGQKEPVSKQGRKNVKTGPTLDAFDDLDADLAYDDTKVLEKGGSNEELVNTVGNIGVRGLTRQSLKELKSKKRKMLKDLQYQNQGEEQIPRDAEIALKVQAELDDEDRLERQRQEKAYLNYIANLYDEVQARIDAGHELAVRWTQEEQEKFTVDERAKLLEHKKIADFVPIGSEEDERLIQKMNKKVAGVHEEKGSEEPDNMEQSASTTGSLDLMKVLDGLKTFFKDGENVDRLALAISEQTTTGREISNPFLAGSC
ncbi:putative ribonuclease H-like domain-containing protein, partial [Tanacetum coccineum]